MAITHTRMYHVSHIVAAVSRTGAFPTATPSAGGAEQAPAPPAPRDGLHRIAGQLIEKENFDHGRGSVVPNGQMGGIHVDENAARVGSAMQFVGGLRDHASLITRPLQLWA